MASTTPGGASAPSLNIGINTATNEPVNVAVAQLTRGSVVIGKQGSGKTIFLENLVKEAAQVGMSAIVLDFHRDMSDRLAAFLPPDRTILVDILDSAYAPGLNLLAMKNPNDRQEVSSIISSVFDTFSRVFNQGEDIMSTSPYLAEVLQMSLPVFLANPQEKLTLGELPLFLRSQAVREKLLRNVSHPIILSFWRSFEQKKPKDQEDMVSSTIRRLENLLIDSLIADVVSQETTTIPIREIMNSGRILLFKLSPNHSLVTRMVGSIMVQECAAALFSRADIPPAMRKNVLIVLDEFSNFDNPVVQPMITGGRKFGGCLVVGVQTLEMLSESSRIGLQTAANLITYQVSPTDARSLAGEYTLASPATASVGVLNHAVLSTLQREGHPDELIMKGFVYKYLRDLYRYAQENVDEERMFRSPDITLTYPVIQVTSDRLAGGVLLYRYDPQRQAKTGIQKLNDFVCQRLTDTARDAFLRDTLPPDILAHFAPCLCFSNYFTARYNPPTPYLKKAVEDLNRVENTQGKQWEQASTIFFMMYLLYVGELLKSQEKYATIQTVASGFVYDGNLPEKIEEIVYAICSLEQRAHAEFTQSVMVLIAQLRRQPITSDARKYNAQSSRLDSRAERIGAIEDALTHPQPFTARARIGNVEIASLQAPLPPSPPPGAKGWDTIRARNIASGYLRSRETVEKELNERHRRLQGTDGLATSLIPYGQNSLISPSQPGTPRDFAPSVTVEEVENEPAIPEAPKWRPEIAARIARLKVINGHDYWPIPAYGRYRVRQQTQAPVDQPSRTAKPGQQKNHTQQNNTGKKNNRNKPPQQKKRTRQEEDEDE